MTSASPENYKTRRIVIVLFRKTYETRRVGICFFWKRWDSENNDLRFFRKLRNSENSHLCHSEPQSLAGYSHVYLPPLCLPQHSLSAKDSPTRKHVLPTTIITLTKMPIRLSGKRLWGSAPPSYHLLSAAGFSAHVYFSCSYLFLEFSPQHVYML